MCIYACVTVVVLHIQPRVIICICACATIPVSYTQRKISQLLNASVESYCKDS